MDAELETLERAKEAVINYIQQGTSPEIIELLTEEEELKKRLAYLHDAIARGRKTAEVLAEWKSQL